MEDLGSGKDWWGLGLWSHPGPVKITFVKQVFLKKNCVATSMKLKTDIPIYLCWKGLFSFSSLWKKALGRLRGQHFTCKSVWTKWERGEGNRKDRLRNPPQSCQKAAARESGLSVMLEPDVSGIAAEVVLLWWIFSSLVHSVIPYPVKEFSASRHSYWLYA